MSDPGSSAPITAVIVTYQSAKTIEAALMPMRECHAKGLVECVLVDNGSSDGTQELLQREAGWARIILTGVNNGFGRGCNIGLEAVGTPYTLFLNPDAAVDEHALQRMLEVLQQPNIGIVGPAIVEGDRQAGAQTSLQDSGMRPSPIDIVMGATPLLVPRSRTWPIELGSAPRRTGWVCGAVLMAPTALLRGLGGFDPRFFLYWEEMDLCKRADDQGAQVWTVGAAVAHHIGGASSTPDDGRIGGCIAEHYYQSRRYYMVKHHGWLAATLAELWEFAMLSVMSLVDIVRGKPATRLRPRLRAPLLSQPRTF